MCSSLVRTSSEAVAAAMDAMNSPMNHPNEY